MSDLSDRFSTEFREEHRAVRDGLLDLAGSFEQGDLDQARQLLNQIAGLTGPHFRYEEEALYPALVPIFGQVHVESLYRDHDGAISGAQRLVELASQDSLTDADTREAVGLIQSILPHVSDCDGLSIMVERLDDDEVVRIFDARDQCLDAGLDLITWAQEIRKPPQLQPAG